MTKLIIIALLSLFIFASPTLAANNKGLSQRSPRIQDTTPTPVRRGLTDAKLTVCQNREQALIERMDQLTKLTSNMIEVFEKITDRIQTYYTDVAIPAGVTVANYGTLVSDIAAKEAVVDTALANAQTDADSFSCDSEAPSDTLSKFRTNISAVKTALREYRASIVKLIVAVRTASSERVTPTSTPTPSL